MARVYVGLGGNLGNVPEMLAQCRALLSAAVGRLVACSPLYRTAAWGLTDQPDFINQVLVLDTSLLPQQILHSCLSIEKQMGRVRDQHWGPRTIDIDVLAVDDQVLHSPTLQLPHPQLANRRFVLQPWASVAPHWVHPELNLTVADLLTQCSDASPVSLVA